MGKFWKGVGNPLQVYLTGPIQILGITKACTILQAILKCHLWLPLHFEDYVYPIILTTQQENNNATDNNISMTQTTLIMQQVRCTACCHLALWLHRLNKASQKTNVTQALTTTTDICALKDAWGPWGKGPIIDHGPIGIMWEDAGMRSRFSLSWNPRSMKLMPHGWHDMWSEGGSQHMKKQKTKRHSRTVADRRSTAYAEGSTLLV